jgi:hypothetical protein
VQQQTIYLDSSIIAGGVPGPVWPGITSPTPVPPGQFPLFSGVRVFSRDYRNPRIYTTNVQFEQAIVSDTTLYLDFTHSKSVWLTRFLNANQKGIFSPQLGEVAVTSALGKSLYRGFTTGVRKRFSHGVQVNTRIQARSAQPITPGTRTATNRNTARKDNEFFSFDWRVSRPFKLLERVALVPTVEMFNTFNNKNLVNPLTTPGLFNFDGFLRQGVGDPRQLQLAVKLTF